MAEHDERAEQAEREVADMQKRSERLEEEIEDVREDWQRKRRDENVPGAESPPEEDEEGPPPEAEYPSKASDQDS